jgi:hypothetical protein
MRAIAALVAGIGLAGGTAASAGTPGPVLQVSLHPLTVAGSHFGARERITVLATIPSGAVTRHTVASACGSFTVSFAGVTRVPPALRVRAFGSQGHAAMYAPRVSRISPPTN